MMIRWRFVLPIAGLLIFAFVSWKSFSWQRKDTHPGRYFWWSSIRLDTDPAGKRFKPPPPCKVEDESSCWEPIYLWRSHDLPAVLFMITAFPAFYAGVYLARLLGLMAVSEITTFMLSMPVLLVAWYYPLGRWIDRRWERKLMRRA